MITWDLNIEKELLAVACRDSFKAFCKHVCGLAAPENPQAKWWTEETHGPLCDWLGRFMMDLIEARQGSRPPQQIYLLINAFRGSGKTMIITKCYGLWGQILDPNLAVVIDAVETTQANEFAEYVKKIFEGKDPYAIFEWLYGNWVGEDAWTKERYTVAARSVNRTEGSFETTSVEKGSTGKHPDIHIGDDYITIDKIRELGTWIGQAKRHFDSIEPTLLPCSMHVYVGTPYTDNDVVTTAMRKDGIKSVFGMPLPPEYAKYERIDGKWHVYFLPGRKADGTPTIPKAWSEERLTKYERDDPSNYAAQIMLRPGSGELVPLSWEQIEQMLCEPSAVPKSLAISFHMDTAFKDPKRMGAGDDSVIEVWGHNLGTGDVYFLDSDGSNQWRDDQFIDALILLYQKWRVKHRHIIAITDEKSIGGKEGIWRGYLRMAFIKAGMFMPRFIEIARQGTKKVGRITEAASYWIDGHVHLVKGTPGLGKLMEQMARIGISAKDDYSDAAADVFHPEIYRPIHIRDTEAPPPSRPYDNYLQGGAVPRDSTELYDQYHNRDLVESRPPLRTDSGYE